MADMWTGAAIIIGILLLPIILPVAYYFANPESFRKYGVWIWLGAGVVEIALLLMIAPLVI